jgi:hypothetical protein
MSCQDLEDLESVIQGSVVRLRAKFYDANGTAVNPTAVSLIYKAVSSTESETVVEEFPSGDIVNDETGSFYFDVLADQAGKWKWRWSSSGFVAASQGEFSVEKANLVMPSP